MNRPKSHFKVCPFYHDHPEGDPSYDDCMVAYEDAKARMAPKPVGAVEIEALPRVQSGHRYRFVYRSTTHRVDHYSVLDALSETESYYVLNARPVAGTQELPKRWVKSVTEVPRSTKIVIGKIVRASDFI
jgi:hypothetical protein